MSLRRAPPLRDEAERIRYGLAVGVSDDQRREGTRHPRTPSAGADLAVTPEGNEKLGYDATLSSPGQEAPRVTGSRLERGQHLGRYRIGRKLGEGGMGVVYAAHDPDLDRQVAIKVLRPGQQASDAARARLLREARAMAKLSHPNVITVHEVGTVGDIDFVAMELVAGGTLGTWLEENRSPREVTRALLAAGRGLAAAHGAGLVHRDFKPANVLIDDRGRAVVTDFGLARALREDRQSVALEDTLAPDAASEVAEAGALAAITEAGALAGTPAYMAPEQHEGGEADEKSDQFSFCVTLFEALCGGRPFSGETLEELRRKATTGDMADPPRGARIPGRLRRALRRGLSPRPSDRYPSMEPLLAELERALSRRRRQAAAWGLAAASVVLAVAAASAVTGAGKEEAAVCDADAELAAVWDDATREDVRRALVEARSAGGARLADTTAERLGAYADSWADSYQEICTATHERNEVNEEDYYLARRCLAERRSELGSLIDSLRDGEAAERAAEAVESLSPVSSCTDLEFLRAGIPPPEDADTRRVVEEIREELAAIGGLRQAGRAREAPERAREVTERARDSGYEPVVAEALVAKGEVHRSLREAGRARSALDEAALVAELEGHDRARAEALVAKVDVKASFSSNHEAILELADRARAAIARIGDDLVLSARLDRARARVHREQERFDEAEDLLRSALARYQRHDGDESLRAVETTNELALVLFLTGRFDSLVSLQREAVDIARRQLGAYHPTTMRANYFLAESLRALGRYDEARELYEREAGFLSSPGARRVLRYATAAFGAGDGETRQVRGRVVDARGEPVKGAEVAVGNAMIGDGKYAYSGGSLLGEGPQQVRSGEDGGFFVRFAPNEAVYAVAEHDDHGRSLHVHVPAGDAHELELELRPFGSLEGTLYAGDDGPAVYVVVAIADGSFSGGQTGAGVIVKPGERFHFERLPAGTTDLLAWGVMDAGGMMATSGHAKAEIRPGERTRADIEVEPGADIEVEVKGLGDEDVQSAQVWSFRGRHDYDSVEAMGEAMAEVLRKMSAQSFASPGRPAQLRGVPPGENSLCVLPLPTDYKDPQRFDLLDAEEYDEIPMRCEPIEIAEGDTARSLQVDLPTPP